MMEATPRPWVESRQVDAIVSRDPAAMKYALERRHGGKDLVDHYGGALVAESMSTADRQLVLRAVNHLAPLMEALRNAAVAYHLARWREDEGRRERRGHVEAFIHCQQEQCRDFHVVLDAAHEAAS